MSDSNRYYISYMFCIRAFPVTLESVPSRVRPGKYERTCEVKWLYILAGVSSGFLCRSCIFCLSEQLPDVTLGREKPVTRHHRQAA